MTAARQAVTAFTGLDLRRQESTSDPRSLRRAVNVVLSYGGVLRTRPGTRRIAQLPPESRGLYAIAGQLRTAVPGGSVTISGETTEVAFDRLTSRDGLGRTTLSAVNAVVPFDGRAYLSIKRVGGINEHHYMDGSGITQVELAFPPGDHLAKAARKVFAPDLSTGFVNFTSTQFGPRDWLAEQDAGFLPTSQHASGEATVTALGVYGGDLVAMHPDSAQRWAVDPDPAQMGLIEVLAGPGTRAPRLVTPVRGDLIYFSEGGFRSLETANQIGEAAEADIGAAIAALTRDLDPAGGTAAVWSQTYSAYFAAFGGSLYVFTLIPTDKTIGWTTWTLPFAVTDIVEMNGVVYLRGADHGAYALDPTLDTDSGVPVAWDVTTQYLMGGRGMTGRMKAWQAVSLTMSGTADVSYLPDVRQSGMEVPAGRVSGLRLPTHRVMTPTLSDAMAIRLRGSGSWQLDALTVDFTPTGI